MKTKLFFAILVMVVTTSAFAKTKKEPLVSKSVSISGSFNKVLIGKNLNVILINDMNADVIVEGNSKFIENVKFENLNGTLTITSSGKSSFRNGTIYVPVKNLSRLDLMADSKVSSNGVLNCKDLEVYLSEGSTAKLKNKGVLQINAANDTELEYLKCLTIKM